MPARFLVLTAILLTLGVGAGVKADAEAPFVVVLGVAQDAGYPQAGCERACCRRAWDDPSARRHVSCLGIVDPVSGERWLVEATPDFTEQLTRLNRLAGTPSPDGAYRPPTGVLLTHAHIGHYTGLVHLGREVMGAKRVPVYVMPRMADFLASNGPWDQLVRLENVSLQRLADGQAVRLNERITVVPLLVPHRDEYSETVGFVIAGPKRRVLFLPDIDKWDKWSHRLEDVLATVDVAYVDGTFYANGEIPNRDMSEIPHPFIEETVSRLAAQDAATKGRVRFIHLNHTNPALDPNGAARREIQQAGFAVAEEGDREPL